MWMLPAILCWSYGYLLECVLLELSILCPYEALLNKQKLLLKIPTFWPMEPLQRKFYICFLCILPNVCFQLKYYNGFIP